MTLRQSSNLERYAESSETPLSSACVGSGGGLLSTPAPFGFVVLRTARKGLISWVTFLQSFWLFKQRRLFRTQSHWCKLSVSTFLHIKSCRLVCSG